jgi:hypothetical protein
MEGIIYSEMATKTKVLYLAITILVIFLIGLGYYYFTEVKPLVTGRTVNLTRSVSNTSTSVINADTNLADASVEITSPKDGEKLIAGDTYPISWKSENIPQGWGIAFLISVNNPYSYGYMLSSTFPTSGSYEWKVQQIPNSDNSQQVVIKAILVSPGDSSIDEYLGNYYSGPISSFGESQPFSIISQ